MLDWLDADRTLRDRLAGAADPAARRAVLATHLAAGDAVVRSGMREAPHRAADVLVGLASTAVLLADATEDPAEAAVHAATAATWCEWAARVVHGRPGPETTYLPRIGTMLAATLAWTPEADRPARLERCAALRDRFAAAAAEAAEQRRRGVAALAAATALAARADAVADGAQRATVLAKVAAEAAAAEQVLRSVGAGALAAEARRVATAAAA